MNHRYENRLVRYDNSYTLDAARDNCSSLLMLCPLYSCKIVECMKRFKDNHSFENFHSEPNRNIAL